MAVPFKASPVSMQHLDGQKLLHGVASGGIWALVFVLVQVQVCRHK